MGRRIGIAIVLVVGLVLLGAATFRAAILEAVLKDRLAARGAAVGALRVTGLGLHETRIADLRLGAEDEVSARELRVTYAPLQLLRGNIERVSIDGLSVKLDLSGGAPPLGNLQPLFEDRGDGPAAALPALELSAARISAQTPLGPMTAQIEGEAWPGDAGALGGAFAFVLEGAPGRLQGAFDVTRTPDGAASGNLVIEDGAVALPGAEIGGLLGEAAYGLFPDRAPVIDAKLSAARIALPDAAFEEAQLSLRTEDTRASLTARMSGADRRWSLALAGTLDDYLGNPEAQFDLSARAQAGAALWPLLALPEPAAGRAEARLTAQGRLPPLAELGAETATVADWLERAALEGQLAAQLTDLAYPGHVGAVSGEVRIDALLEAAALRFELPRPARLHADALAPAWLRDMGLPDAALALLEPGAALSLAGHGRISRTGLAGTGSVELAARSGAHVEAGAAARLDFTEGFALASLAFDDLRLVARALPLPGLHLNEIHGSGSLAGPADALAGELTIAAEAGDIAVGALRGAKATAALPVSLRVAPDSVSLRLPRPGRVTVAGLAYGAALRSETPLHLDLAQGMVKVLRDRQGRVAVEHEVSLVPEPVSLAVAREAGDLRVQVSPGPIDLSGTWSPATPYRGTARLHASDLVLPDRNIGLEGLTADLSLGGAPGRLKAEFDVGVLKQLTEAPILVPLGLRGSLRGGDEILEFSFEARDPGQAARIRVSGQHDLAAARGQARVAFDPIVFAPERLQPAALAPALQDLRAVRGEVQAGATIAWEGDRIDGQAKLSLSDLSFDSDQVEVAGLDLALSLDRLSPSGSPAGQRLSARRLDPFIPLENIVAKFQVQPGEPFRLAIESGEFELSGGRFVLRDVVLDPAQDRQDLPLRIEGLDLAELFRIFNVVGLSGSGRLSGAIPLALIGKTVAIESGRLEATGAGVLQVRSERVMEYLNPALAAAGEDAQMLIQALQDFHYQTLSIAIRESSGETHKIIVSTLGHNPEVSGGQPFALNIALDLKLRIDIADILKLVRHLRAQGWRYSAEGWRLAP